MSLAAGYMHTCALSDLGRALCVGHNDDGQTDVPEKPPADLGQTWREVATGHRHTCALSDLGRVYCVGDNLAGQADVPEKPPAGSGTQWGLP